MDRGIGHVLNAVSARGAAQSTLVVFISDNGAPGTLPGGEREGSRALQSPWGSRGRKLSSTPPFGGFSYRKASMGTRLPRQRFGLDYQARFGEHHSSNANASFLRPVRNYPTNYPLKGYKGSLYEGGIRTIAVALMPGTLPEGSFVQAPMHISDWFPTIIHKALNNARATSLTDGLDGKPVWDLLTGKCDASNNLSCRGKEIYISSNLPILTPNELRAATNEWLKRGNVQMNPVPRFVERGAQFSMDGTCKFFLDPDGPDDSHGFNTRTLKPSKSEDFSSGRIQPSFPELKASSLWGQIRGNISLEHSVLPDSNGRNQGDGCSRKLIDRLKTTWIKLTRGQEPDYGGRLARFASPVESFDGLSGSTVQHEQAG